MLRADLALYDRYRQLVALVELKNRLGTSSAWAAQFRRNLLSDADLGPIPYFLIVTPEWLYLWKEPAAGPGGAPDHAIELRSFLRPYMRTDPQVSLLQNSAFELVVGSWFADLMHSRERASGDREARARLEESGLIEAVKDGRVEYELAA